MGGKRAYLQGNIYPSIHDGLFIDPLYKVNPLFIMVSPCPPLCSTILVMLFDLNIDLPIHACTRTDNCVLKIIAFFRLKR